MGLEIIITEKYAQNAMDGVIVNMNKIIPFKIVRVVTKDLITDSFQSLRNLFGLRLRGYEKMLNKSVQQIFDEMNLRYKVKWFRMQINPLTNGSAMIIIYGEGKVK